jgi:hypothetical protein
MPAIEDEHTKKFYMCVDAVVNIMFENDRYLHSKRSKELSKIVAEQIKCSIRTAERYIAEAKKEIRKIGRLKKEEAFIKSIRDLEFLLSKTKNGKNPDYKRALEVIKERNKVYGLYAVEEKPKEITSKNIDMSLFTDYGLERLKRGDSVEDVLLDPKSLKFNAN